MTKFYEKPNNRKGIYVNHIRFKRLFSLLLIFTIVLGFFTPAIPNVKAAEVITVADAIANNTGTATVEGYIVGTVSSSTSFDLEAPFTMATNLALADSPNETDIKKMLPVQLPSGSIRTGLNLVDNPSNYKAKIQITGNLEAYYTIPGLKSPTSYTIIEGGTPTDPQPEPTLISISEARSKANNTEVIIEGVVTADNSAIGGGKLSTYIQDATAGINLYSSTLSQDLKEGDKVKVLGKLAEYNGLKEIVPTTSVEVLASNQPLPQAKSITLSDLQTSATAEPLEGQLVKVTGYVNNVPSTPAGGGYNVSIIDNEFNGTTLRIMEGTSAISEVEAGKWYEFTAIVSQYNSYQLLPRKAEDIQLLAEQPVAPNAEGEYPAVVANVVDGDTVNLVSPVLGSTKVRFVNIDTPETFNAANTDPSRTEINANQKEHGEAAKAHMNTLLAAGDEIILKIGQEPTDAYGRLLAQVVRKDTNLNVNLDMVRQGYAATYFIYPIGNEDTYNEFQAAVKEAKDNKRGIWSETNPLLELPFVFRTNDDNGIFDKFVGNSDTKLYVSPEKWEDVPVEKRVFFWNETDANYAGYEPAAPSEEPVGEDPNGSEDNIALQLLSLNDLHGKIDQVYQIDTNGDGTNETVGRMDYVAAYLKDRETANTFIVNAGDMIGGSSPVSALLQDEPTVEIMEAIGFDYGTVGNHEFDEGTTELLRMVNGGEHEKGTENYDGMNFPVLCANCISKTTGEPILPAYDVTEVDGVKVGFIGVNTTATATMVIPSGIQDIRFTDEETAVNKAVSELKAQGVKSIIVLAHMPASQSGATATGEAANLANSVDDEVDVIFAAHNHEIVDAVVDNKLIVQALDYGKAFADIDLEIDPTTRDIVKKEAEIVYVDQSKITPDATVSAILTKYLDQTAEIMNLVVGVAAVELKGGYGVKGPVGDNALGNLIADSMAWAMGTDFALMNGGGIRDNINAGDITWSELFNVQPFGNILVSAEITGAELEAMLNAQISAQYGPDVSVGGFKYTWDGTTNKVVDIYLPNGSKINKTATYTVTVNNYMYEHSTDKYKVRGFGENPIYGLTDLEGLVGFVESFNMEPINYVAEGRISEIVPNQEENLGEITIAEARAAEPGAIATIEGVVTSTPGAWGSKAFYIQDETSGSFVFTSKNYGFEMGDIVKVTGKTALYNGEFQLADLTSAVKVGEGTVPTPHEVSPADLSEQTEGQLVLLKGATISELEGFGFGTFEFTATKNGESVLVRVDNRTGLNINNFTFENGDIVDITGVSGEFKGTIQLKPRMMEDIVASDVTAPVTDITLPEADFSNGSYLENVVVELSSTDAEAGVEKIEYSLDGGETWTVYEAAFAIFDEGTTTISYRATDRAGNVEEVKSIEVNIIKATLSSLSEIVEVAETSKGVITSTQSHITNINKELEKGKTEHGYKQLEKLQQRIESYSNKTIKPEHKADILLITNFILENKTL